MIKNATFTSVWDGGYEVTTNCKVDMETRAVFDIEVSVGIEDFVNELDYEYITLDGKNYAVLNANEEDDIDKSDFWYE